ncbi:hypothetical protein MRB53_010679 [Persea americana]|uniref:Uncharacterized protein n=1 Tax=Persea americana TaxID=3435 RepID=A0ACC2LSN2_PERAE|nr:hypothetical protein MRB53_010679 [Persea americana]
MPKSTYIEGGQLKLTWFYKNFIEAPENASEEDINRLHVGRPPHVRRDAQYEHAVQQMDIFLKHIVATVDSVDEKYDSWFLYKIMQTIQHQSVKFLAACSAGFEKFNLEECINSKSYENFNKENEEEEMGQVPPDVHTPQPSPFANPMNAPHSSPFQTTSARPQTSPYVVPSPTPQPPLFVPSSSTPEPSPYVIPIPATQPPPFIPSSSTPPT